MGSNRLAKGGISSNQVIAYTKYDLDEDCELVNLKPLLALGNRAVGQDQSLEKSFSRRDWPGITVGGAS